MSETQPSHEQIIEAKLIEIREELQKDENFLEIEKELKKEYETQEEGISTEHLYVIYKKHKQDADRLNYDVPQEEMMSWLRLDIGMSQIDNYMNGVRSAAEVGRNAVIAWAKDNEKREATEEEIEAAAQEAQDIFEKNMRELESLEVLAAMGGEKNAVAKLNRAFANPESKYDFSTVINDFTHAYEERFTNLYDPQVEFIRQDSEQEDKNNLIRVLKKLAKAAQSPFAIQLAKLKLLDLSEIQTLLAAAQENIDDFINNMPKYPAATIMYNLR